MNREQIIKTLTEAMFDTMECDAEYRWSICKFGHKGFENMTDEELKFELKSLEEWGLEE